MVNDFVLQSRQVGRTKTFTDLMIRGFHNNRNKKMTKYRVYINDYGSWYGPEFVTKNSSHGLKWDPSMKIDEYETYSDTDACFYFTDVENAKKVVSQLTEWGHPGTIFMEID